MNELVKTITEAIQEKKGSGIVVADLTKIGGTISNYFIICEGNSPTQVEAICESVGDMCRERLKEKPMHVGAHLPARRESVLRPGAPLGGCRTYEN